MKNTLKIDHSKKTIVMDRTFAKLSENTRSEEYAHLQQVRRDYPNYLVQRQGNIYDFYEVPRRPKKANSVSLSENDNCDASDADLSHETEVTPSNKEIYNKRDNQKDINIDKFIF